MTDTLNTVGCYERKRPFLYGFLFLFLRAKNVTQLGVR